MKCYDGHFQSFMKLKCFFFTKWAWYRSWHAQPHIPQFFKWGGQGNVSCEWKKMMGQYLAITTSPSYLLEDYRLYTYTYDIQINDQ